MLRKSFSLILKPSIRPYALNLLKCSCNNLVTSCSYSTNERSVLADPGIIKADTPEKFQLQKILTLQQVGTFDQIQNLRSPEDVIQFLRNNRKIELILHGPLFVQILKIMKSNKSTKSVESFINNAAFEIFCKSVRKSARALRPSDILDILKTLKSLNVSTNSLLSQTLLQVVSKSINELNVSQLVFISYLIRDAPSSPIVEALRISIPIVFNTNVRSKLNYGNAKSVSDALRFAISVRAPFKIIDLLADAAFEIREQLTFHQCREIVSGFLCKNYKIMIGSRQQLYSFCMSRVRDEMEENMTSQEISRLTAFVVNAFLFSNSFFYDEVFLTKVTKYIVANKLNLSDVGTFMRNLTRISYIDLDLINYVDLLLSQTADLEKMPHGVMPIIAHISACSDARYLPPNWDTYEKPIVDYFLNMEDNNLPLMRIVLELISLNRWHIPLINKVLAEDFLRQCVQRTGNKLDYFNILNLYQAIKTSGRTDVQVLPPDDIINTAIEYQIESKQTNISPFLETLFGGKSYVVNGILSKYGHFIDHLLVLNKTGEPLPIREQGAEDGQKLQNMVLPTNGYVFAVISLFPSYYCIDGIKLRGKFKLIIDTLATQDVIPVPISITIWESLQDSEKLPYLQREIFSRIPGSDSCESSEQLV